MTSEIHFQEIFSGELIQIQVDGEQKAKFEARTKFQIGLAHIEILELEEGSEVTIELVDPGIEVSVKANSAEPYIIVQFYNDELGVTTQTQSPGYV